MLFGSPSLSDWTLLAFLAGAHLHDNFQATALDSSSLWLFVDCRSSSSRWLPSYSSRLFESLTLRRGSAGVVTADPAVYGLCVSTFYASCVFWTCLEFIHMMKSKFQLSSFWVFKFWTGAPYLIKVEFLQALLFLLVQHALPTSDSRLLTGLWQSQMYISSAYTSRGTSMTTMSSSTLSLPWGRLCQRFLISFSFLQITPNVWFLMRPLWHYQLYVCAASVVTESPAS